MPSRHPITLTPTNAWRSKPECDLVGACRRGLARVGHSPVGSGMLVHRDHAPRRLEFGHDHQMENPLRGGPSGGFAESPEGLDAAHSPRPASKRASLPVRSSARLTA
jgi:hypothetical protein